jgi:hypothetical protein
MLLSGQFAADLDVKALPLVASKDILPRLLNHLVGVSIAFLIGGNDRIGVDVGIAGTRADLLRRKGLLRHGQQKLSNHRRNQQREAGASRRHCHDRLAAGSTLLQLVLMEE